MSIPTLPDDLLHLLCDELAVRRDYDTLFNCCCASKGLAAPALTSLYRTQHLSPIGSSSDTTSFADTELLLMKYVVLWRSIILSAMGKTMFPYCRYIVVLNFTDLEGTFEDDRFRRLPILNKFFSDDLAGYKIMQNSSTTRAGVKRPAALNVMAIVDALGELVTQHCPFLEEIRGNVLSSALIRWVPRIQRLRSMSIWSGEALADTRVASLLRKHCRSFDELTVYRWMGQGTDSKLAAFISELAPNSLRSFVTHSDTGIGLESFLALSGHGRSLKHLKLCLHSDALPAIAHLKGCTELETLDLEDLHGTIDMEKNQNDVFLETIAWLRECKSLREVSFKKFQSAPALMVPILLEDKIRLERVEIESPSYALKDSSDFHMALANQKSIQSLGLQADGEDAWGMPVSTFIDSLGKMTELRELRLNIYNCESIGDTQISALATALENLEGFYINTGWNYTDAVLGPVAKLKQLRNITFGAFSRFTTDGLLEFVAQLGSGNQGMVLTVDAADPDAGLSDEEQNLVREALNAKVGGEFGYQFWRDPDVSEFEGESD